MLVVDVVQQREAEIRMYGLLADSLGPRHLSSSTQQRMQEMLKALCSPDNVTKVRKHFGLEAGTVTVAVAVFNLLLARTGQWLQLHSDMAARLGLFGWGPC